MVRGSTSRLIFIDSSVNTHHDRTKVFVPTHPFSAQGEERLAISLLQFSMRRNWYNINATNNAGYIYVENTHHVFFIEPGVYSTFGSLETALNTALASAVLAIPQIDSIVAGYNATKRFFAFTVTMATGFEDKTVEFKFYAVKHGALPPGVLSEQGFNDVHETI